MVSTKNRWTPCRYQAELRRCVARTVTVGIPPLAGFVGKFLLFAAAIDVQYTWVAVVAIINSVLSLAVYLRLVVPMYRQGNVVVARTDIWLKAVLIIALTATLLLGVFAQVFVGPFA